MDDTRYFTDAFCAFRHRTGFAGNFQELPIEEQSLVLRDAQTLKTASRLTGEAMKHFAAQPMYPGERLSSEKR